jgi:hypothetical protein
MQAVNRAVINIVKHSCTLDCWKVLEDSVNKQLRCHITLSWLTGPALSELRRARTIATEYETGLTDQHHQIPLDSYANPQIPQILM